MNKEVLESLRVGLLAMIPEDAYVDRFPNEAEMMDKINELIDKFNCLIEVIINDK